MKKSDSGQSDDSVSLTFDSRGYSTFPFINKNSRITSASFSDNPISSFEGLPTIETLKFLYLDKTKISSFKNANEQPNLQTFYIREAPISHQKMLTLMSCIVFGNRVSIVNSMAVTPLIRAQANSLRQSILSLLKSGWILTSIQPVRLIHSETRKRRVIYLSVPMEVDEPPPRPPKKTEIRSTFDGDLPSIFQELMKMSADFNKVPVNTQLQGEGDRNISYRTPTISVVGLRSQIRATYSDALDSPSYLPSPRHLSRPKSNSISSEGTLKPSTDDVDVRKFVPQQKDPKGAPELREQSNRLAYSLVSGEIVDYSIQDVDAVTRTLGARSISDSESVISSASTRHGKFKRPYPRSPRPEVDKSPTIQ